MVAVDNVMRVNLAERYRHQSSKNAERFFATGTPSSSSQAPSVHEVRGNGGTTPEIPYNVVKIDDPRLVRKQRVLLRELESRQSSYQLTENALNQHDRSEPPASPDDRLKSYFKTLLNEEQPQQQPQAKYNGSKLTLSSNAMSYVFAQRDETEAPELIKIYPVLTSEKPYYFSGSHHPFTPTNKYTKFEIDNRSYNSVEGYVKTMLALELRGDREFSEDENFRRYAKQISQRQLDTWIKDRGFLHYQRALVARLRSDPDMLKKLKETEKRVIIYTFRLDEVLGSGVEFKAIDKYWEDLSALRVCLRYPTKFPLFPADFWIVPRLIKGYNILGTFLMAIRHRIQMGDSIHDLMFDIPEYSPSYGDNLVNNRRPAEDIDIHMPLKRSRRSDYSPETLFITPSSSLYRPGTPNTIMGDMNLESLQNSPVRSECQESGRVFNEPVFKAPFPKASTMTSTSSLNTSFTQYRKVNLFGSTSSLATISSGFPAFNRNTETTISSRDEQTEEYYSRPDSVTPTPSSATPTPPNEGFLGLDLSKICSPNLRMKHFEQGQHDRRFSFLSRQSEKAVDRHEEPLTSVEKVHMEIERSNKQVQEKIESPVQQVHQEIASSTQQVQEKIESPVQQVHQEIASSTQQVQEKIESPVQQVHQEIEKPIQQVHQETLPSKQPSSRNEIPQRQTHGPSNIKENIHRSQAPLSLPPSEPKEQVEDHDDALSLNEEIEVCSHPDIEVEFTDEPVDLSLRNGHEPNGFGYHAWPKRRSPIGTFRLPGQKPPMGIPSGSVDQQKAVHEHADSKETTIKRLDGNPTLSKFQSSLYQVPISDKDLETLAEPYIDHNKKGSSVMSSDIHRDRPQSSMKSTVSSKAGQVQPLAGFIDDSDLLDGLNSGEITPKNHNISSVNRPSSTSKYPVIPEKPKTRLEVVEDRRVEGSSRTGGMEEYVLDDDTLSQFSEYTRKMHNDVKLMGDMLDDPALRVPYDESILDTVSDYDEEEPVEQ